MHSPHAFSLPPDLQQALCLALEYRKGGRPAEAVALYRQQLAAYPHQPDLLGQLADLLMSQGDFQAALPLLEQGRAAVPGQVQFWLMQAQCLLQLGRARDARKLITEAIGKGLRHPLADELLRQARAGDKPKPGKPVPLNEALRQLDGLMQAGRHAEVERLGRELLPRHAKSPHLLYLLGMAALLQGRPGDAVPLFERAVALDAGMVPALYNLGFALDGLGRLDEAAAAYRRASARAPHLVDAHNNLGHVLQKLGRHDEALAAIDRALSLRPDAAEIHMNRGNALRDLERTKDAVAAYETALKLKPNFAEALINLAAVQYVLGCFEDALDASQRAVECRPDAYAAYQGKGKALRQLKRYDEAVVAFEAALALKPDDPDTYKNLGGVFKESDRYEAAIISLQRAVALRPDSDNTINLLAGALLDAGRHEDALAMYRRGLALAPDGLFSLHSNMLLGLNYQAGASPASLLAEARVYGDKAARKAKPFGRYDNLVDPERRLRVGFVSGDLGQHPVGFFLQNVLESLDPEKLELFAYATAIRNDELNERLRRSFGRWCDATSSKFDDAALAERIHEDGVDILIDLAGHTGKNRLPVFAWKSAPIQVTWLGYLGTTGLEAMDYLLADAWALPVGEEDQFTETPWRMPESYICFSAPDLPVAVEPLPALERGYVTFGCFNNLNKVTDQVVACWARLLQAAPDSRLYLKTKSLGVPEVRERLVEKFARLGIDAGRLIIEGKFASHEDHFRAYHQVDIALDPFPYPGITTTMEALWMGVPVLSMRGQRFISHQGETILHNLGLPQWIADSEDDYVAKAAAFAGDVKALAELRAGLRERLLASPLCDAPRFARNFEAALRGMWQKWCEQQKPAEAAAETH